MKHENWAKCKHMYTMAIAKFCECLLNGWMSLLFSKHEESYHH